jgi:hypothetical protein
MTLVPIEAIESFGKWTAPQPSPSIAAPGERHRESSGPGS